MIIIQRRRRLPADRRAVQLGIALLVVAVAHTPGALAFVSPAGVSLRRTHELEIPRVSRASSFSDESNNDEARLLAQVVQNVTTRVSEQYQQDLSAETALEEALDARKQNLERRAAAASTRMVCEWEELAQLQIAQVKDGVIVRTLDAQTLDAIPTTNANEAEEAATTLWPVDGLVVTKVAEDSVFYREGGVRVGHRLVAASATLGDAVWRQSTLAGLSSALRSRRKLCSSVSLDFSASADDPASPTSTTSQSSTTTRAPATSTPRNQYELTLTRPLGLDIMEEDGYVVVTGFQNTASKLAQTAVQVGDRIMAVDASLGSKLWPVSTVQGVQSACTSRLPGQAVTLRFERPLENLKSPLVYSDDDDDGEVGLVQPALSTVADVTIEEQSSRTNNPDPKTLLKRCRTVLERYALQTGAQQQQQQNTPAVATASFKNKHAIPGIVADRVVETVKSAGMSFDALTLSLVMQAYQSVDQPQKVVDVFEAATGWAADGSDQPVPTTALVPDASQAVNAYTVTALLRALISLENLPAVETIWRAMTSTATKPSSADDASAALTWSRVQPDTATYNTVLCAYDRLGSLEDVEAIAARMKDPPSVGVPSTAADLSVVKSVITYNILIHAYANADREEDAWRVFTTMAVAPDIVTYTSMIPVCSDADIEELWYDMIERGVEPDVHAYNARIRALCAKRQWTQATRLVTEMERTRGIFPDSRTYGLLMTAMLQSKPSACLALFESACSAERTHALTDNVHLYTTAVAAAAKLGNHERALELVSRMKLNCVRPDVKTLTALMGACIVSNKYKLAADVYRQMQQSLPNDLTGPSLVQGVCALCGNGEPSVALEHVMDEKSRMSGKERMRCYTQILKAALSQPKVSVDEEGQESTDPVDYDTAKRTIEELLRRHFIPSKSLVQDMLRSLGLEERRRKGLVTATIKLDVEESVLKFDFLLFLLDAFAGRNLDVPASLYASVLILGNQLGGKYRTIASLVNKGRQAETIRKTGLLATSMGSSDGAVEEVAKLSTPSWHDISENPRDVVPDQLPRVSVQISQKELPKVLRAERVFLNNKKAA